MARDIFGDCLLAVGGWPLAVGIWRRLAMDGGNDGEKGLRWLLYCKSKNPHSFSYTDYRLVLRECCIILDCGTVCLHIQRNELWH